MITGTRRAILEHLLDADANAVTLANRLDINISAIRNHLDAMELAGLVSSRREPAERGRPKRLYSLTPLALTLFPQKTAQVTAALLQTLNQSFDTKTINDLIRQSLRILWKQIFPDKPSGSLQDRLDQIVQALNAYGCYASLNQDQEFFVIVIRNFMFREVVNTAPPGIGGFFKREFLRQLKRIAGDVRVQWVGHIDFGDHIQRIRITPRRERE